MDPITTPEPPTHKGRQLRPAETQEEQLRQSSEEVARQERLEYLRSIGPKRRRLPRWLKMGLPVAAGVLVVAAIVYVGIVKWPHKAAAPAAKDNGTANAPAANGQAPATIKTKRYDSSNFGLSINYPEDWQVTDKGDGKLIFASKAMKMDFTDGMRNGQVVITFQAKQPALNTFDKGNAIAALESERIAYTQPAQGQRAQTYISFLRYAGAPAGGLNAVYVTGDAGYKQGQAIPQVDVIKVDPLITVTFAACGDQSCGSSTPASLKPTSWNDTGYLKKAVETTLTSLAVQ